MSGHQPVYLPGIIVMAKIAISDAFMWVGHCDYQRRSWHSHNFIRGAAGPIKLTVPIRNHWTPRQSINDTIVCEDGWQRRHLTSIEMHYGRRPYFKDYFPELKAALLTPCPSLARLNITLANLLCHWLNIDTPIHFSENWNIEGHKTAMLVDMCDKLRATDYLSSPGEAAYIDYAQMNGYAHRYLKFTHPVYDQGHKNFLPNLSVIDLLFNCGPDSGRIVRRAAA